LLDTTSLSHTHTRAHTHTHTNDLALFHTLSFYLSFTHYLSNTHALALSLSHTVFLFLSLIYTHSLSPSLSLTLSRRCICTWRKMQRYPAPSAGATDNETCEREKDFRIVSFGRIISWKGRKKLSKRKNKKETRKLNGKTTRGRFHQRFSRGFFVRLIQNVTRKKTFVQKTRAKNVGEIDEKRKAEQLINYFMKI